MVLQRFLLYKFFYNICQTFRNLRNAIDVRVNKIGRNIFDFAQ